MKPLLQKRFAFIGKSLLWSFLLYLTVMVCFNWDDVRNAVIGRSEVSISNSVPNQQVTNASAHSGAVNGIITVVKTICGFTLKARN